jgi:hypothetical protein
LILSGFALLLMWITVLGIPFAIRYGGLWVFILQTASVEELGPGQPCLEARSWFVAVGHGSPRSFSSRGSCLES